MKKKIDMAQLLNIVGVVLILALVLCHFIPFWTVEGETMSVWEYIGFPKQHKNVTTFFTKNVDANYHINNIVLMPSFAIFLGALAVIFAFKNSDDLWFSLFPAVVGVLGIRDYLLQPVYQYGNMWFIPLIVSILMFLVAVAAIVFWFRENKKPAAKK